MIPSLQELPEEPRRHRRPHQEHPGAEGVDLRELTTHGEREQPMTTTVAGDERQPRLARPPPTRRRRRLGVADRIVVIADGGRPGHPGALAGLAAGVRVGGPVVRDVERHRGLDRIQWVGFQNYHDIATIYPPFWPAMRHNLIWLVFLFVLPTLLGILLAVILDREMWGSRFYQTAFYLPVVLSLALVGFIWQLFYSTGPGPDQPGLPTPRSTGTATPTSTSGRCWSRRRGGTPATSC